MSAQPIHDPRYDPQIILDSLPEEYRPSFLNHYLGALESAREPAHYHRVPELLRLWRMKSIAYATDPTLDRSPAVALDRLGKGVPLEHAVPDWAERLAQDRLPTFDGPITPYRQLAATLKARLLRGDWQPNRPIPSEARLVQEYGLARTTMRRSIKLLVDEGLLFVVPQRGTFVAAPSENQRDESD